MGSGLKGLRCISITRMWSSSERRVVMPHKKMHWIDEKMFPSTAVNKLQSFRSTSIKTLLCYATWKIRRHWWDARSGLCWVMKKCFCVSVTSYNRNLSSEIINRIVSIAEWKSNSTVFKRARTSEDSNQTNRFSLWSLLVVDSNLRRELISKSYRRLIEKPFWVFRLSTNRAHVGLRRVAGFVWVEDPRAAL